MHSAQGCLPSRARANERRSRAGDGGTADEWGLSPVVSIVSCAGALLPPRSSSPSRRNVGWPSTWRLGPDDLSASLRPPS